MKKTIIILIIAMILLVTSVLGAIAPDETKVLTYLTFDDDEVSGSLLSDLTTNSNGGSITSCTTGETGIYQQSFDFDGTNDLVMLKTGSSSLFTSTTQDRAFSFWFKADIIADSDMLFTERSQYGYYYVQLTSNKIYWKVHDGSVFSVSSTDFTDITSWHHLALNIDFGGNVEMFLDGVSCGTESITSGSSTSDGTFIGKFTTANFFNGHIDEFLAYDGVLTTDEIDYLYNSGSPGASQQWDFVSSASYFDITNTNGINNMTIYFNSTSYSTINGTINTGILDNEEEFIIITEANEGYYFNKTYTNYNISDDLAVTFIEYPRVTIYDQFSLNGLSGFNVSYDTTIIQDVTGIAYILLNETRNITISKNNYFSKIIEHNFTNQNDLNVSLYQSIINISINESLSGNPVNNWVLKNGSTVLINTSVDRGITYLPAGDYNSLKLISNVGAFSDRALAGFNVFALDNKSINYEIFPTELNITAKSILTGLGINNFTISISSTNRNHTQISSSTSGSLVFGVVNSDVYNVTIDALGYALFNNSHLVTISGNTFHSFSLYTNNSINFTIKDEDTNSLITELLHITLTGSVTSYSLNVSTGIKYMDNIVDGTYSIKIWNDNYTARYYAVTVASRSFQQLNAYLSKNSNSTTSFTFRDDDTGSALENALFSVERVINGSWAVVMNKYSDVTGKVSINYVEDTAYRFTASKNGYTTKTFSLDPIEDSSYTVKLEPDISSVVSIDDISIIVDPYLYYEGLNNFSFLIISPGGVLTSYNLNVFYPGGSYYSSGSNSIGETFSSIVNITGATIFDIVRVNYNYITVYGTTGSYTRLYPLSLNATSKGTYADNKTEHYGLGLLERVLIVIGVIIILSGIAYAVGGAAASLGMGLIIYGAAATIGFIPIWLAIVTFVAGIIVLASFGGK